MANWKEKIKKTEITGSVTSETVNFAKSFGEYLGCEGTDDEGFTLKKLTTSQLRKFFGEVKRQQMMGYNQSEFILLKPKLAYAVGRARKECKNNKTKKEKPKIEDFYEVIADAIDQVKSPDHFKNFIKIFEAIVAYHKAAEEDINNNNQNNEL